MNARSVFVEPGSGLAATHRAALTTLPIDFSLIDDPLAADILAGSAAFMHEHIANGARASMAVLVAPRSEAWDEVDALWAAVEYRDITVVPAAIDIDAIAPLAALVGPVVTGAVKFLVEVHLESLGVEETRLAQVVQLLDALGVTCPEARVGVTGNGWVAAAQDERMTLRAHCLASKALPPRIRIRLSNNVHQCTIELPMGADARPLTITTCTPGTTAVSIGKYESPARAFWLGLAANAAIDSEQNS